MTVDVRLGDCRDVLAGLPDCSVDSVVTDPPYELGFMGKRWDASGIAYNVELWAEVLRVLKPGGHLLAFGGTRTYHRMACAIEDAGFEVRDSLHWLYGSGFPKSLDVSKAIDKAGGNRAEFAQFRDAVKDAMKRNNVSRKSLESALGNYMLSHYLTAGSQPAVPNYHDYVIIRDHVGLGDTFDDLFAPEAEREVVGTNPNVERAARIVEKSGGGNVAFGAGSLNTDITAPATDAARRWSGWGTALKPAHEPIVVARKPLVGTVAGNVLAYGTGALNIDGCRVGSELVVTRHTASAGDKRDRWDGNKPTGEVTEHSGRWPANLVLTHAADCEQVSPGASTSTPAEEVAGGIWQPSEGKPAGPTYSDTPAVWRCADGCPVAELDGQSGDRPGGAFPQKANVASGEHYGGGWGPVGRDKRLTTDSGGASRFFTVTEWDPVADVAPFRYVAKPSKRERNAGLDGLPERNKYKAGGVGGTGGKRDVDKAVNATPVANHHPTVKPVALMRWLVRLVTPPGGVVLDPFAGSGTTLVAAVLEGFDAIGIEMTDDYLPIIKGRIAWAEQQAALTPDPEPTLFDGSDL